MKANEIMTTEVITVTRDSLVKDAAKKMAEADVGSVLVSDGESIVGIITDRDVTIRGVAEFNNVNTVMCEDIMSEDVIAADSDADMEEVIELMADYQIKRIPIMEDSKVVGIVSLRDLSQSIQWEDEAGEVLNDITKTDYDTAPR